MSFPLKEGLRLVILLFVMCKKLFRRNVFSIKRRIATPLSPLWFQFPRDVEMSFPLKEGLRHCPVVEICGKRFV